MSPLSPAYFAFAAIVITLYWACYRWKQARLCILLLANGFFLARLAWFYPILLLAAASVDFLVGLELQRIPRERKRPRLTSRVGERGFERGAAGSDEVHPGGAGGALSLGVSFEPVVLLFTVNDLHD